MAARRGMRHDLFAFFCLVGLMLLIRVADAAEPPEIIALTEDFRPFSYRTPDGTIAGISTTLMRRIFERAGIRAEFRLAAWAESFGEAARQPNHVLFLTLRTPAREAMFRWIGPVGKREMYLVKLRQRQDLTIAALDQAQRASVAVPSGDPARYSLEKLGWILGKNLIAVAPGEVSPVDLLLSGKVDLITASPFLMSVFAAERGLPPNILQLAWKLPVPDDFSYIAVNPATDPALFQRLETAFRALEAEGEVERIMHPHVAIIGGTLNFSPWYVNQPADPERPGAAVELTREVARRLGVEIEIAGQPIARLLQNLDDGTIDLTLGLDAPAYHQNNIDCGEIGTLKRVIGSSAAAPVASIADLAGKRLGMLRSFRAEQSIGRNSGAEQVLLDNMEQGMRMLGAGRVDALLAAEATLKNIAASQGLALAPFIPLPAGMIHIWVSPASYLASRCAVLADIATAMRREDVVSQTLSRYN